MSEPVTGTQPPPTLTSMPTKTRSHRSAVFFLVLMVIAVFLIELVVMVYLPSVFPMRHIHSALLDAVLLSCVMLPLFYFLSYRPMVRGHAELKSVQDRLQLAQSVFVNSREGISITDAKGTILDVNEAFSRITGYSREEALGRNPRMLQSGRQSPEFYATMWRTLISKGYWSGEVWNRRKNGEVYAEILNIGAVHDATGKTVNYVALFSDITTLKEHQSELEHLAHFDTLTGLPNRLLLSDRLNQCMSQCQRDGRSLTVVSLDLDNIKAINDNYGHTVGDTLLIEVANRMKAALRERDTLARIGGDEFVAVIVDQQQSVDSLPVLERLLQAAAAPIEIRLESEDDNAAMLTLQVSASLGVTFYPQDAVDAGQLLRHADQAMFAAKQAGKNRYHLFDIAHDAAIHTLNETLKGIRTALAREEFVLYYQPKVNMRTGRVTGVEALIRWQHPTRGLLPPAAFLPAIDNQPVGIEIGEWVIQTALAQMQHWQSQGLDLPVSVNVGADQLQNEHFSTRLNEFLSHQPSVSPSRLQLEVLETSALDDMAKVSTAMNACRKLGVNFALDDFGTGYSSLTYLRRLPAHTLKIDQSFVRDMLDDQNDLAIVRGVIGLAKAFGREVIAEGVETSAHGQLLLSSGCDLAQGYGIARPMPATALADWVANWHVKGVWAA